MLYRIIVNENGMAENGMAENGMGRVRQRGRKYHLALGMLMVRVGPAVWTETPGSAGLRGRHGRVCLV